MDLSRRRFLLGAAGLGTVAAAGWGVSSWARPKLWNPCRAALPPALADHPVVQAAWAGIDPARVWDCHVHIAGTGDSGSGITTAPEMRSLLSPVQFAQRLFYLNAGCVHDAPGQVDQSYVERMRNLVDGLRPGAKLLLFAFDRCHDEAGRPLPEKTAFHVPDAYARDLVRRHPDAFEWACSIHPYRPDAVAALEAAVADGARAVKWLPAAMGMDPASPRCDAFYTALARLDLPLISHAGEEKAVHGANRPEFSNPLRLRRALDHGVRVVVAHCASIGQDEDLDRPGRGQVASFELFARLMAEARYEKLLFADISAVTQRNRSIDWLKSLLARQEWHGRLLNGSDYPLPGVMPLFAPRQLAAAGLLEAAAVPVLDAIQAHNPLLFDFVLKRQLRLQGRAFADNIFHTRDFFLRSAT
jgi:mannonate dehydratase